MSTEEFPARGLGEFEALGGLDFFELGQDSVAKGLFRMAENIEASDPANNSDADEYQDEYRPSKKATLIFARWLGWVGVGIFKPSAAIFCFRILRHFA
ncbi:MAG: hypothetical protein CAK90_05825 [Spartobacteria bacterium AMD-G4]|nr:MAG: hypothetical protein CAK90_05825 [Spartobacteria bacterium AMD-G4]